MSFKVVSISNGAPAQDYYCYPEFFKSANRYGVEPIHIQKFFGLASKINILYEAIVDGLADGEITIFADCYDLVFVRPINEMVELFKTKDCDVMISTEINCFPDNYKKDFDELGFGYLNSGFIIGYTDKMKIMLEAMGAPNVPIDYQTESGWVHFNDQTYYQEIFLKQPVRIKLDTNSELCQCMYGLYEKDVVYHKGAVEIDGKFCYVVHWNGGAKTLSGTMQPILKHLGLR